jgi:hypothetical protein
MTPGQRRAMVILVAAISIVTAILMLPAPQEGSREGLSPLFPGLTPDAVTRLEIRQPGWREPAILVRDDDGWRIEAPVEARADDPRVGMLLRGLVGIEVHDAIDTDQLEPYGLAGEAGATIVLDDASGGHHTLRIGGEAVGGGRYLLVEGEVLPASVDIVRGLPVQVGDLRDRHIWARPVSDSVGIRIFASADRRWEAGLDEQGTWQVTEGVAVVHDPGEPSGPEALLRALDGALVASFLDDWEGIDLWVYDVQLIDEQGRPQSLKLYDDRRAVAPCCSTPVTLDEDLIAAVERYTALVAYE